MTSITTNERGAQRLSLEQLRKWEALKFGMFIHYGMSTYTGSELPDGSHPSTLYAPDKLDVDQWISVARDASLMANCARLMPPLVLPTRGDSSVRTSATRKPLRCAGKFSRFSSAISLRQTRI
jgi:hypothetical protein